MKTGVATGVPLALLLLSALDFQPFRERRRRIRVEKLMQNAKTESSELNAETYDSSRTPNAELQELEEVNLRELNSKEIHEVS